MTTAPGEPMLSEQVPTRIEGVAHDEGAKLLRELVDEIHWFDRSPFLSASAAAPDLPPVLPTTPALSGDPVGRRGGARRVGVAFAPEHGTAARDWAAGRGLPLLAADAAVTALAGDKIHATGIFRAAGVQTPETLVVPAKGRAPAASYWPAHWPAAVVQRRANNLTGRGTWPARDRDELARRLARVPDEELRVSRLVEGPSLTVSACVAGDRVAVSAVSRQLVGVPELTPHWGGHCGNQLLGADDLPGAAYERAREAARAVGEELRLRGYRGVFGLDLVVDGADRVLAVEINPRFQTVVSLVQRAERAAGLLPSLALHVLACLLPSVPVRTAAVAMPSLAQLVSCARDGGGREVVDSLPAPGRYRLADDGSARGPGPGGDGLTDLAPGEALVWWQGRPGGPVAPGDELLLTQLAEPVTPPAATARSRALLPGARAWMAALAAAGAR
ncbi:ATP-grasp domain-containing protein [Streptomyces radicis]|uniref:ATP-grasp domain-containing protein n=1 Tax=Streptomyces radicis TaxID=1750517 RepID=A0A3A9W529_9ACTN|nr:ATP-grasp domain-containing protein [Streptomyces radicis]RKN08345.1 ATP-grasp domain-containing protein [Streptomyces radicis]RKN21619.1 ATP-grasp domain-containing protein [Streptomyces radicis]